LYLQESPRAGRYPITARHRSELDNPFMVRASPLSLDNVLRGQGGPFGAVLVKNGTIVAEGVNRGTFTVDAAKIGFDGSFMMQRMRQPALAAFHACQKRGDKIPY